MEAIFRQILLDLIFIMKPRTELKLPANTATPTSDKLSLRALLKDDGAEADSSSGATKPSSLFKSLASDTGSNITAAPVVTIKSAPLSAGPAMPEKKVFQLSSPPPANRKSASSERKSFIQCAVDAVLGFIDGFIPPETAEVSLEATDETNKTMELKMRSNFNVLMARVLIVLIFAILSLLAGEWINSIKFVFEPEPCRFF
jgi:hypothetical protein